MRSHDVQRRASLGAVLLLGVCVVLGAGGASLLLAGCSAVPGSAGSVTGSGSTVARQYDLSGFTGVRLDNACDATVTRGDAFAVTVTVNDNLAEHLVVEVDGDTLHIGLDPSYSFSNVDLEAQVTMPDLQALELSGASVADVRGFAADSSLAVELSGASKASLAAVSSGDVSFDISGASSMTGELRSRSLGGEVSGASRIGLEGSGTSAELEASGGSELGLRFFALQDAGVTLSGGSQGQVRVSGTLDVDVSGGSQLDYFGSPSLGSTDVSGGSELNRAAD